MSSEQAKRKAPLNRLGYPLWIPMISRTGGVSRPISPFDPAVLHQSIRIVIALTLLYVPLNIVAESHAQQSSAKRITMPLASSLETLGVEPPTIREVFLPASEAFTLTLGAVTTESITVSWAIADGYYLYRDKFQFVLKRDADQQVLGAVRFPAGQKQEDPTYGHVEVFYRHVQAVIPWHWESSSTSDIRWALRIKGVPIKVCATHR